MTVQIVKKGKKEGKRFYFFKSRRKLLFKSNSYATKCRKKWNVPC